VTGLDDALVAESPTVEVGVERLPGQVGVVHRAVGAVDAERRAQGEDALGDRVAEEVHVQLAERRSGQHGGQRVQFEAGEHYP